MPGNQYVRAVFEFADPQVGEIPLTVGDVIEVIGEVNDSWLIGRNCCRSTEVGNFPKNFVEPFEMPCINKGQKVFLATRTFHGEMTEDLSFNRGDLVMGISAIDANWWNGQVRCRTGIFPLTFVTELILPTAEETAEFQRDSELKQKCAVESSHDLVAVSELPDADKTPIIAKARAILDLDAQLPDELGFRKGDVIEILQKLDEVFALGRLDNAVGQLPLSFVEIFEGNLDSSNEGMNQAGDKMQIKPKFDWWKDPKAAEVILSKSSISISEATPSFEEQTAPIVHDEEYTLNTSHAFYSKLQNETGTLLDGEMPNDVVQGTVLSLVRSLFMFRAENDNELGFEAGEFIAVIGKVDDQWMEGDIKGRRGIFPSSYVEILKGYSTHLQPLNLTSQPSERNRIQASDSNDLEEETAKQFSQLNSSTKVSEGDCAQNHSVVDLPVVIEDCSCQNDFLCKESLANEAGLQQSEPVEMSQVNIVVSAFRDSFISTAEQDENEMLPAGSNANISSFPVSVDVNLQSEDKDVMEMIHDQAAEASEYPPSETIILQNVVEDKNVTDKDSSITLDHAAHEVISLRNTLEEKELDMEKQQLQLNCEINMDGRERDENIIVNVERINSSMIDITSTDCPSGSPDLVEKDNQPDKLKKPAIKPKPKLKPKSDSTLFFSKSVDCANVPKLDMNPSFSKSTESAAVPKKSCMRKGVTFCLDNIIIHPKECIDDENLETMSRASDVDSRTSNSVRLKSCGLGGKAVTTRNGITQKHLESECLEKLSASSKTFDKSNSTVIVATEEKDIMSPTSPSAHCHVDIGGEIASVRFQKGSRQIPLLKPIPAEPVSSLKKKAQAEKDVKKETDGLKIGQSLFYGDSLDVGVAPVSPTVSKKVPPRPARPKQNPTPGTVVLPTGIFYTSLLDESRPKPVPCRPAPPRPQASPPRASTSRDSHCVDCENLDVIKDIERRISEIEQDLENYKREEVNLIDQLESAADEDEINAIQDKLEFCRANAFGLTDELTNLKENLSQLKPQSAIPADRRKMAKRKQEENRKKRQETRAKVVDEMVQTEHDYIQSLCLCLETFFNSDISEARCPPSVDLEVLFGNIYDVVELSQKFLNTLEVNTLGKPFDEQLVGVCFEEHHEELKRVYAIYCRNHDGVITLLEKYEALLEVQEYFATLVKSMRVHATVFDIGSILIKPVQRILKYPLLLEELLKTTDEGHQDYPHLIAAVKAMRDVAVYINEFKRRKDLVLKYKKPSDMSLRDMFSRLTVHSYKKKISRLSMMVVGTLTIDENFSREELKFSALEECVTILIQSIPQYLEFLQKSLVAMETVACDTADYYGNNRTDHEIDQLCRTYNCLTQTLFLQFKNQVQIDILPPLSNLLTMLQGPQKLVRKRYHKLLDLENARMKQKSNRDADQIKPMNDEVQSCRSNYEAMNAQLLEELPKFYRISVSIISDCLRQFLVIREGYIQTARNEISKLLKLKLMRESSAGIVEHFNIAHTEAVDLLSDLSFIPKSFNPLVDEKRKLKDQRSYEMAMSTNVQQVKQTDDQRTSLTQTYPHNKLFVVSEDFEGTQVMDLRLSSGVLVGVIKESDPMGNRDRFLVTDGSNRGFVPKRLLVPFGELLDRTPTSPSSAVEILSSPTSSCSTPSSIMSERSLFTIERSFDSSDEQTSLTASADDVEEQVNLEQFILIGNDSQASPLSEKTYYRAEYSYDAEGDVEVNLSEGEVVLVLEKQDVDGNVEWWLVERSNGRQGYVPATYLCNVTV